MEDDPIRTAIVDLDSAVGTRLTSLATSRGLGFDALVTEALVQYVEREEARVAWIREGDEALAHYDRTGLHLTDAEVGAWIDRLVEGEDVDPPKCHT